MSPWDYNFDICLLRPSFGTRYISRLVTTECYTTHVKEMSKSEYKWYCELF
jgi:hypothetical protein